MVGAEVGIRRDAGPPDSQPYLCKLWERACSRFRGKNRLRAGSYTGYWRSRGAKRWSPPSLAGFEFHRRKTRRDGGFHLGQLDRPGSGEQPAFFFGLGDALNAKGEGREPPAELHLTLLVVDARLGLVEDGVKFRQHFAAGPIVVLQVLQPFEVGDDDPARIAEHVGNDLNLLAGLDHAIGAIGGGTVRRLGENAAAQLRRIGLGDHPLDRRGDEDGAGKFEQLFVGDGLTAVEIVQDAVEFDVLDRLAHVDALRVVKRRGMIGNGDDLRAIFGDRRGRLAADIAEALDRHGRLVDRKLEVIQIAFDKISHTPAGRFAAAFRSPKGDRLAGDNRRLDMPDVVRIGCLLYTSDAADEED